MKKTLALYVWHDSLTDYTHGVMFALAGSTAEAREQILKNCAYVPDEHLAREPLVYTAPAGFAVWGGG